MENLVKDNRFSHLATDPSFRRAPKYERKVKIDKRFQSMFTDDKFKVRYTVDKRGRPVSYSSNENLRKYYALSSDEEEDNGKTSSDDSEDEESPVLESISGEEVANITEKVLYDEDCKPFTSDEKQEPDKEKTKSSRTSGGFKVTNLSVPKPIINAAKAKKEKISDKVREKLKNLDVDYARGESAILTDSSSDDESSDDSVAEFEEKMAHEWGELDKDAGTTDQSTSRLAVCNMDWDRIRAADLMVLFSSFTPVEGYVKSVTIYPSEFGLERMKEEDIKGPTELVSEKRKEEEDNEDEEGGSYHMEILRKYQLNRLKYFYAVVECDSVATADKLYAECDGLEYESSAIRLDLRFIPDDMVFDQKPREVCNGIPDPTKYKPRFFITKALQQAKVECTWDETNPDRLEIAEKIMKSNGEVDDEDIQAYLASSSGESEAESEKLEDDNAKIDGDEEERIAKYRALIADIQEKEKAKSSKDVEMEVTWGIGLKNETEKLVKQKLKEQEELTPFEKYLEKRKEKRKQKRKERKQANSKDDDAAFSDDDLPSDVDLDDPYFKEELEGLKKGKPKKKGDSAKIKDAAEEARRENYRAQLKLLMMDFEEKKNHFNMDEIMKQEKESGKKKKRKAKKTEEEKPVKDDFELNVKDPRFEALYSSHLYNIDPADPHFKKTKAMEALVNEKLNRRNQLDVSSEKTSEEPDTTKKNDAELSLLVKSVKRKAENLKAKKKQKC